MVDPALGHSPFSQTETMGKALKHLDFRIRSILLDAPHPLLHGAVGGDAVSVPTQQSEVQSSLLL